MVTGPLDDARAYVVTLLRQLTEALRTVTAEEAARLQTYFAHHVLPGQPTPRVRAKHAQHVEDDKQWPDDTTPEAYLTSLRKTVVHSRAGIYLAKTEVEHTWTIYFVGPVPYRWRGRYPGRRIVVLFNAERFFWITGFQAEAGIAYVDRQGGFWVYRPH